MQHLPFKFPGEKKFAFAAKLTLFLSFGFSIPFLAAAYQLYVPTIMFSVAKLNFSSGERAQDLLIKSVEINLDLFLQTEIVFLFLLD